MNSKVKINSLFNNLQFLVFIIVGIINAPYILGKLGLVDYGIWVFIMSILSYSSVLYLGFGQSVIKYTSEFTAKKDYESANTVLGTVFTFYTFIGAIAFTLGCIVAYLLPNLIAIPEGKEIQYQVAMVIVSFQISFLFPTSVFGGILMAKQKYVYTSSARIIAHLTNLAVVILTPSQYFTIIFLALVFMLTTTISHGFDIIMAKLTEKELKVSFRNFDPKMFKKLFSFSIYSFLIVLSDKMIELTDTIIIGIFLTPAAVALYSVPQRLVNYLRMLLMKSSEVLFPHFTMLLAKNKKDQIKDSWLNGFKLSLAIATCITVVYLTYGGIFQVLWMQKEEFQDMHKILIILSLGFLLNQPMTNSFLIAVEKHKTTSKLSLLQALLNLVFSIILVQKYGLTGVALASCVPSFIISSLILPFMANKLIGIPPLKFLSKSIAPPLLCGILPFIALSYLKNLGYGTNYIQFGSICAICVILFAIPYVFIFDKSLFKLTSR